MRVRQADWAAQTPWGGIQDRPAVVLWLGDNVSVEALQALLNGSSPDGGLATVAYTGKYSDLVGLPSFGSAAFVSADNFVALSALFDYFAGTANEIGVVEVGGVLVFSLPAALTFTGKTVTGGTFNAGTLNPSSIVNLIAGIQALSGAGAVDITHLTTEFTSTGAANALTLANGTAGQLKTIIHKVDGGSGVLTPATPLGFATITFTNAGETATLQYTSAGWVILSLRGAVAA